MGDTFRANRGRVDPAHVHHEHRTRRTKAANGSVGRGRDADSPMEIPARGWKDIFTRVKAEAKDDDVTLMAAGVAFYSLLAIVPGLVALISIYGLVATPSDVSRQITSTLSAAPREVRNLVTAQLESITASAGGGAVLGASLGTLVALWSASSGVGHLMDAVNRAYDEEETRGFVRLKLIALALTIGAIVFLVIAFAVIALLPSLLAKTGLGTAGRVLVGLLRWILLMAGMTVGLGVVYRYGPDREERVGNGSLLAQSWPPSRGSSVRSCSPSTPRTSRSTTRPTAPSARSSSSCCGSTSPPSQSCSVPRSTAKSNGRRPKTAPMARPSRSAHGTQLPLTLSAGPPQR